MARQPTLRSRCRKQLRRGSRRTALSAMPWHPPESSRLRGKRRAWQSRFRHTRFPRHQAGARRILSLRGDAVVSRRHPALLATSSASDYLIVGLYFLGLIAGLLSAVGAAPRLLQKRGLSWTLSFACALAGIGVSLSGDGLASLGSLVARRRNGRHRIRGRTAAHRDF